MVQRYSEYDAFARMYDRHWGPRSLSALDLIERLVLARLPSPARVLDLCCGTGQVAHALTERGHDVLGVDGSESMLAYARRNAPEAHFLLADARDFRLEEPVDVVLSLFDSLNHLMCERDLAAAFRSAARALHPGGVFAFDLNMEIKYLETWAGEFSVVGDHEVGLVRASVDPETRRGLFDVVLFYEEGEGVWSRKDLRLAQTWYSEATVARLLDEAGFNPPSTRVNQPMPEDATVARNMLFVTTKVG